MYGNLFSAKETLGHGSYLGPLCHLPLWTTGRAFAGPPLYGPLQVGHGAEFTVDRAVQARRQHLPTSNLTELETLPAGSWTLAPAARLPPEHEHIITSSTCHGVCFCSRWILPGLTLSADAEVVDRLRPGQCITVHVMDLNAVIANTCDEGLWDAWTVTANRHLCLTLKANESESVADGKNEQKERYKVYLLYRSFSLFRALYAINFRITIQFHTFICNR